MSLTPGTRLGPYVIAAPLGAGGMGEVYRANDPTLERDVAIKVLAPGVAQDPERLARFEREARLLASLNHSNIAHVYGFESATLPDGSSAHFLAMELVEGEDLAERLERGRLPVDEALEIARQIADGLEEAHEKGIVHRDLKPANVRRTPDGKVKVLDFGLARAYAGDSTPGSSTDLSQSPTLAHTGTQAGVLLGTAGYMAPEQARGKPVDKRGDIWAFGVVLFEMLTGRPLFGGETLSDVLAAVLTKEVPWPDLPSHLPPSVRSSLRRCLERDPRRRLRDIGDVRLEGDPADAAPRPSVRAWPRTLLAALAGAAVGGLAVLAAWGSGTAPAGKPVRLSIVLPEDRPFLVDNWPSRSLAIAPDGSKVAYVAADPKAANGRRLYLRSLDRIEAEPVAGAEGAHAPFFSPDGQWLAFFTTSEGALRKVPLSGGPPLLLTRGLANPAWINGSWSPDGWLVFQGSDQSLRVLPEGGGVPRLLTSPNGEVYRDPQPLPGSGRLLYTASIGVAGSHVETSALNGDRRRTVLENANHARYLDSGHLLFSRDGVLLFAPFEPATERVGDPVPLPLRVKVDNRNQTDPMPQLAVSRNGTLAYVPTSEAANRECTLSWLGASGNAEPLGTLAAGTPELQLSPDGRRLAVCSRNGSTVRYEVLRLDTMTTTLVADVEASLTATPVWHPDGRHIVVVKSEGGNTGLWSYAVGGEDPPRRLAVVSGGDPSPSSFSPDGRYLIVTTYLPETSGDVLIVDLGHDGGREASVRPFFESTAMECCGSFSPDGRLVAYASDESGRLEVYVRRFPGGEGVTRVSVNGGVNPRWSPRGDAIDFASLSTELMSSRIQTEGGLRVGPPGVVFQDPAFTGLEIGMGFDVAPDGRVLVRTLPEDPNRAREIVVVQNWFEEVRALAGTR